MVKVIQLNHRYGPTLNIKCLYKSVYIYMSIHPYELLLTSQLKLFKNLISMSIIIYSKFYSLFL